MFRWPFVVSMKAAMLAAAVVVIPVPGRADESPESGALERGFQAAYRLVASPLKISAEITADDLLHVVVNTLIVGRLENRPSELAYSIPHHPRDDGSPPDRLAGDGIYTARVDQAKPPDYASYRHKFLWGLAKDFDSTCTRLRWRLSTSTYLAYFAASG